MTYAAVNLSRFSNGFGMEHIKAVRHLIRYLYLTRDYGLVLGHRGPDDHTRLHAYADASHMDCLETRKSTSGVVCMIGGSAISWRSKRQSIVAQSTTEAEYVALAHATRDVLWLRQLFQELHFATTGPTALYEDNRSAVALANDPKFHERSKHIDLKYHLVRHHISEGTVQLTAVPSTDMLADIFTKPLSAPTFQRFRTRLGVIKL